MGTGQGYRGYRSRVTDKGGYRSGISWVQVSDIVGTGQ